MALVGTEYERYYTLGKVSAVPYAVPGSEVHTSPARYPNFEHSKPRFGIHQTRILMRRK